MLPGPATATGVPMEIFKSGESQSLGVKTEGEPDQSHVLMVSVPYALKAADVATLGGPPASAHARAGSQQSADAATTASVPTTTTGNGARPATTPAAAPVTTTGGTSGYLPVFNGTSSSCEAAPPRRRFASLIRTRSLALNPEALCWKKRTLDGKR